MTDKYVNTTFISGSTLLKRMPNINVGTELHVAYETYEVAAADADADVHRIFKGLDPCIIPIAILVATDGITGATVYDLGIYETNLGAVVDADAFAANMDLSSAVDLGFLTALDGMDAVAIENYGRKLFEHAGHTEANKRGSYDIAFTLDTAGTGAGTLAVLMLYAQG